jgi:GTP-binding protein Era
MNNLLHEKLSIVTNKPQTTRHRILGVLSDENYQIIFLDTPGVMHPKYQLQKVMVNAALQSAKEADLILFMVEPCEPGEIEFEIIDNLKNLRKKTLLLINKIDLVRKGVLLPVIDFYKKLFDFDEILPISALKHDGMELLLPLILKFLPIGEPFYSPDTLTNRPERFFVSEIIREQIFECYGEEIPYHSTVIIDEFKERGRGADYIRATIYVERASQKKILIGKNGKALKKIGEAARGNIESFLGRKVYLELWVKERRGWRKNIKDLRRFGYIENV